MGQKTGSQRLLHCCTRACASWWPHPSWKLQIQDPSVDKGLWKHTKAAVQRHLSSGRVPRCLSGYVTRPISSLATLLKTKDRRSTTCNNICPLHTFHFSLFTTTPKQVHGAAIEAPSMFCQKCRQPLRLDGSLQDLNPAAYDLLTCWLSPPT